MATSSSTGSPRVRRSSSPRRAPATASSLPPSSGKSSPISRPRAAPPTTSPGSRLRVSRETRRHAARSSARLVVARRAGLARLDVWRPMKPPATREAGKGRRGETNMRGLMQDWPLLCHRVIDHAATYHGARTVVSRSIEGPMHTTNYADIRASALKVAKRLERDGIKHGDRVATLAWNTWRHLEAWYGILGIGAIYHTVNPRLFADQIVWIINHAEDRVVLVDLTFVPLLEKLADKLPTVERYIVLTDAAHMPPTTLRNAVAYETWIAETDGDFVWKSFDENTAAGMCYTSGTTGNPKGVVYSHRSNILQALSASQPDAFGLSSRDIVMPVVPLFHANGWMLAFSAPMAGASIVMPGMKLDGASIYEMLTAYKVSCSAAVPTIWLMLLQYLEANGGRLPDLKRVVIGGSACPRAITQKFQDVYGVEVIHAWGMTEMSPLGSLCTLKP